MSTCERCWDGRHLRCTHNGCTCTVCAQRRGTAPPKPKRPKPIYNKEASPRRKPKTTAATPKEPRPKGPRPWTEQEKDEIARQVLALVTSIYQETHTP